MTKRAFKTFVRQTLKTATTSSDEGHRLAAAKILAAMVLAQEYAAGAR